MVTGSNTRGEVTQSVRPGRTAVRNQGISTGTSTGGTRVNSNNMYTRPNTGTYTRRSTTNIDRTGSNYNRPSSTRRSSDYYNNNSNTRSTFQRSNTTSSGSSFSRSSSSYSRSSGGSVSRSSGGGSRRR